MFILIKYSHQPSPYPFIHGIRSCQFDLFEARRYDSISDDRILYRKCYIRPVDFRKSVYVNEPEYYTSHQLGFTMT